MYGLKGANQTTKAMTDALLAHYESPSFCSPNKRIVGGAVAAKGRRIMSENGRPRVVRDVKKRVGASTGLAKAVTAKEVEEVVQVIATLPRVDGVRLDEIIMEEEDQDQAEGES